MKASYKVNSKVIIELEAGDQRDLFEQLASLGEVFGQVKCGRCQSEDIKFVVRTDKEENKYYSMDCLNEKCKARLSFGCAKKGNSLFIKRKDENDKWISNKGWRKWLANEQRYE